MARNIAAGIDIGTHKVKVTVAEEVRTGEKITHRVIGRGEAETHGMEHGFINKPGEVSEALRLAVNSAEKQSGVKVTRAFTSVGGIGLSSITSAGSIIISRADLEITERDMALALDAAEKAIPKSAILNRKIINTIPFEYKADGRVVWGRVEGMKAQKLEVKALFITCLEHHLEDLVRCIESTNVEVVDMVPAPMAASLVTLTKREMKAGCLLANLGAETLSIVVFENGMPITLEVFPIGSSDITNDIALGLKIPLEEAENLKIGAVIRGTHSKKKLDEIISARLSDCFELIETHLKKIGRNALLPAGIIITGGGAGLNVIRQSAESALKLPAKIAEIHFGAEEKGKIKSAEWAVSYGLTLVGFNAEDEHKRLGIRPVVSILPKEGAKWMKGLLEWFNKFLP